jgi:Protein of unknown function (DUF3489)
VSVRCNISDLIIAWLLGSDFRNKIAHYTLDFAALWSVHPCRRRYCRKHPTEHLMRKSASSSTTRKTAAKRNPTSCLRTKRNTQAHPRTTDVAARVQPSPSLDSKLGSIINLLLRPKGASIADLCKTTGWQAHSVRGALSGAIKKKLGLNLTSEKTSGARVYRIAD